jgi:hypothetical protein
MKVVNKIIVFVLALGIFPVVIFQNLVRVVVSISKDSSLYTLLSQILKDSIDNKMEITISVKEAIGYIKDGQFSFAGMSFSTSSIPSEMLVTKNWLIASGACIVAALLIALVLMGSSLFTKAYRTIMCLSAGGIACTYAAVKCFTRFAAPFIDGTIDIGAILAKNIIGDNSGIIGSVGSSFLEGAIKVDVCQLGNVAMIMAILFFAIIMWTLAYFLTLPEKEKKPIKFK